MNTTKCAWTLVLFSMLILIIIMIVFSFKILVPPIDMIKNNYSVLNNWSQGLILDIKITEDSCPFAYHPLKLGSFNEMMVPYQFAKYSYDYSKNPETNYMGYDRNSKDLINFTEVPIYSWRRSIICILRSKAINQSQSISNKLEIRSNYHTYFIVQAFDICPIGLQKCPHPLDTLNQFMCVLDLFECGINFIKIVDLDFNDYDKSKIFKLPFGDGKKSLLIGRGLPNLHPVIEISLNKGEMCSFSLEKSLKKENFYFFDVDYLYSNECQTKIGGRKYNPYFIKLDTDSQSNVFSYSSYLMKKIKDLPKFPLDFLSNYDYNLYYSTYIGFHSFCAYENKSFYVFHGNLDSGIVVLIIFIFIMLFITCCVNCCVMPKNMEDNLPECLLMLICISSLSTTIPTMIMSWVFYSSTLKFFPANYLYNNWVKNIDTKCFDNFHSNLIEYQNNQISFFISFYLFLCLGFTVLLLSLLLIPFYLLLGDKYFRLYSDDG